MATAGLGAAMLGLSLAGPTGVASADDGVERGSTSSESASGVSRNDGDATSRSSSAGARDRSVSGIPDIAAHSGYGGRNPVLSNIFDIFRQRAAGASPNIGIVDEVPDNEAYRVIHFDDIPDNEAFIFRHPRRGTVLTPSQPQIFGGHIDANTDPTALIGIVDEIPEADARVKADPLDAWRFHLG